MGGGGGHTTTETKAEIPPELRPYVSTVAEKLTDVVKQFPYAMWMAYKPQRVMPLTPEEEFIRQQLVALPFGGMISPIGQYQMPDLSYYNPYAGISIPQLQAMYDEKLNEILEQLKALQALGGAGGIQWETPEYRGPEFLKGFSNIFARPYIMSPTKQKYYLTVNPDYGYDIGG